MEPIGLSDLDKELEAWEARLARIDANLVELESQAAYQQLSRPGGFAASLEGPTRQRVGPALSAVRMLFESRGRLAQIVERARAERESISALTFWENDERARAAMDLLRGPSVQLSTDPTPIAERGLLAAAVRDVSITPQALLDQMVNLYEVARDAITTLTRAWSELEPALEQAERALAAVRRDAACAPADAWVTGELAAVERDLAHARKCVMTDPLGAEAAVVHVLVPRVEALSARVAEHRALGASVRASLVAAHEACERLAAASAEAGAAVAQARLRYTGGAAMSTPCSPEDVEGMRTWLATLVRTVDAGRLPQARVGLERWHTAAAEHAARTAVARRDAQVCERWREELEGRSSARRAQARAVMARLGAAGGSAAVELAAAVERAATDLEARLAATPIDFDAANAAAAVLDAAAARMRRPA